MVDLNDFIDIDLTSIYLLFITCRYFQIYAIKIIRCILILLTNKFIPHFIFQHELRNNIGKCIVYDIKSVHTVFI